MIGQFGSTSTIPKASLTYLAKSPPSITSILTTLISIHSHCPISHPSCRSQSTGNMSPKSSKPTPSSSAKTAYLTAYNGISCILWATILGRTVNTLVTTGDYNSLYGYTGEFVKWSQTAAMMEIAHSLFGKFVWLCTLWVVGQKACKAEGLYLG